MRSSLIIPNSIGWSKDQKTLYFVDTTKKNIIAFDYSASTGDLSNERVFFRYEGDGSPDGFKMDEEGNIWQAIYGDSCVVKISPEGKVIGRVNYPTKAITCPAFVGTELWVTTAGGDAEKYSGGVFKVDVGVGGLKDFKFKLDKKIPDL